MTYNTLNVGDTIYVGVPFTLNGEYIKCGSHRLTRVSPEVYKFWGKHFLRTGIELFGKHFTTYSVELAMMDFERKLNEPETTIRNT